MENTQNQIYFNFSYLALRLLGKGLYSNHWSAISELVANGIDAQANNIKIVFDLSQPNQVNIEIMDDGCGMSYSDLAEKYAFIGKDKRRDEKDPIIRDKYMGRKGIGKLAALYLSKKYYIVTKTCKEESVWYLDSSLAGDSDVPHLNRCSITEVPIKAVKEWNEIRQGTLLVLTDVNLSNFGEKTLAGLKARLADFYLLDEVGTKIEIALIDEKSTSLNFEEAKKEIAFKNMCSFYYTKDGTPLRELGQGVKFPSAISEVAEKRRPVVILSPEKFIVEGEREFINLYGRTIKLPYKMEGWIGIHTSINKSEAQRNDKIFLKNQVYRPNRLRLYVRKKLAVENFLEYVKNTHAMSNYIEGEISFDILESDELEDIATSNRQGFVEDDVRIKLLVELVKPIINALIKSRVKLGNDVAAEEKSIQEQEKLRLEEEKRKAEEEKRIADIRRAEAEHKQKEEELLRKREELLRKQEEQRRIEAEINKKEAEQKRIRAEQQRIEAEQKKKEEEQRRISAELQKKEEEQRRKRVEQEKHQEVVKRREAEEKAESLSVNLGSEMKRNEFLMDNLDSDQIEFAQKLHMVKINLSTIMSIIQNLTVKLRKKRLTEVEMKEALEDLSYQAMRIRAILRLGAAAKFDTKEETIYGDLFEFINEYCTNIASHEFTGIEIVVDLEGTFSMKFAPQDVAIILDNIIDNSKKAKAHILKVRMGLEGEYAIIDFIDDGKGLEPSANINEIFAFGKSYTASGIGVGLFHIKSIVEEQMNGSVGVIPSNKGFHLQVRL